MIAFRLCLELGYSHPDELLSSITAKQWMEWLAFFSLEPFGEERADLRAGIVASVISNRMRGKRERSIPPHEFMPYYRKPKQSAEEIKQQLRLILRR